MHNILQRRIQSTLKHMINDLKPLKTVITKRYTLGVWQGFEHASSFGKLYIWKGGRLSK